MGVTVKFFIKNLRKIEDIASENNLIKHRFLKMLKGIIPQQSEQNPCRDEWDLCLMKWTPIRFTWEPEKNLRALYWQKHHQLGLKRRATLQNEKAFGPPRFCWQDPSSEHCLPLIAKKWSFKGWKQEPRVWMEITMDSYFWAGLGLN